MPEQFKLTAVCDVTPSRRAVAHYRQYGRRHYL